MQTNARKCKVIRGKGGRNKVCILQLCVRHIQEISDQKKGSKYKGIELNSPGKFWGFESLKPFRNRYFQVYLGLKKRKIFRLRRALL